MLTETFDHALVYASQLHRTQKRKATDIPYVAHLLAVASIALEHGADEEIAIAALLHDAVEDQGGVPTLNDIRTKFGERVAAIVEGCTDSTETDPSKKADWTVRKKTYMANLAHHDRDTLLVSCADKLHNARSILSDLRNEGLGVFQKFTGKLDGTLWYYRELTAIFDEKLPGPLARELLRTVGEIERIVDEAEL